MPIIFLICACTSPPPKLTKVPPPASKQPMIRVATDLYPLTVKKIPLEHYLMNVLQNEIPAGWPKEALKTQAVAARTFAIYKMKNPRDKNYDVTGGVEDQRFEAEDTIYESIYDAVRETEGEVLTKDQKIIPAFFHSSCGGMTETASNVWEQSITKYYLPGVKDPYCNGSHDNVWEYELPKEEFEYSLAFDGKDLGKNWTMEAAEKSPSGRTKTVKIKTSGSDFFLKVNRLRELVGFGNIKSALFDVSDKGEVLIFKGRGSGHGVGLCQWGANVMSKKGKTYDEILEHYYPATSLKKLY